MEFLFTTFRGLSDFATADAVVKQSVSDLILLDGKALLIGWAKEPKEKGADSGATGGGVFISGVIYCDLLILLILLTYYPLNTTLSILPSICICLYKPNQHPLLTHATYAFNTHQLLPFDTTHDMATS